MSARTDRPLQPISLTVSIAPSFVPALERVIEAMRLRNSRATDAQLLDTLFARGLVFTHDAIAAGIWLDHPHAPPPFGDQFGKPASQISGADAI